MDAHGNGFRVRLVVKQRLGAFGVVLEGTLGERAQVHQETALEHTLRCACRRCSSAL